MTDPLTEKKRLKRPCVDEKSFALAEHFLSDLEGDEPSEDQKWELAGVIQQAVEDWFEGKPTMSDHPRTTSPDGCSIDTARAHNEPVEKFAHRDPTGTTREPPHCPSCSCGLEPLPMIPMPVEETTEHPCSFPGCIRDDEDHARHTEETKLKHATDCNSRLGAKCDCGADPFPQHIYRDAERTQHVEWCPACKVTT